MSKKNPSDQASDKTAFLCELSGERFQTADTPVTEKEYLERCDWIEQSINEIAGLISHVMSLPDTEDNQNEIRFLRGKKQEAKVSKRRLKEEWKDFCRDYPSETYRLGYRISLYKKDAQEALSNAENYRCLSETYPENAREFLQLSQMETDRAKSLYKQAENLSLLLTEEEETTA